MTKSWVYMAGTALALMTGAPAFAQDTGSDQGTSASTGELGEILVTAQRRSERLRDVPLSITAQTGDDLAKSGITNLRELGNTVPGLIFTTQGGISAPTIRGIQSTLGQAGADSPTALYVDGVYQPNILANVMDIADIERVEVLKGPQGTLFGRNATAGAIMIHTTEPSFTTKGAISISDGLYFGAKTSHDVVAKGYVTGPLVDGLLAGGLSGYYEYVPGYFQNDVTGGRTGKIEKYIVRAKLLLTPSDNLSFLLSGLYSNRDDDSGFAVQPLYGLSIAGAQVLSDPNNPSSPLVPAFPDAIVPKKVWHTASQLKDGVGKLHAKQSAVSFKAEWNAGDEVGTFSSMTAYSDTKADLVVDIHGAYAPSCVATFACIIYEEDYPSKTFQQELNFSSAKWGAFSLVAGAFYYTDKNFIGNNINPPLDSEGNVAGRGPVYFSSTIKTKAAAGFGELNVDATDNLHLIGGIRYSWEKRTGYGDIVPVFPTTGPLVAKSWTPRFSVRYDVSSSANVYATFSKGFKSGVLDSTGQSNFSVRPEKVTSYEVGVKIGTPTFSLSADAFYYDYTDLQVQFFDGVNSILKNAADAQIYGFEGDLNWRMNDEFGVRLTGAWLPRAKYKDFAGGVAYDFPGQDGVIPATGLQQVVVDASGDRMIKAPKFSGSAALSYDKEIGSGKIDANLTVAYVSNYFFDLLHKVNTKGYATVNGVIGYSPTGSGMRFTVFGKNMLNKKYFAGTLLGNQVLGDTVYSPPAQFGVGVDFKF